MRVSSARVRGPPPARGNLQNRGGTAERPVMAFADDQFCSSGYSTATGKQQSSPLIAGLYFNQVSRLRSAAWCMLRHLQPGQGPAIGFESGPIHVAIVRDYCSAIKVSTCDRGSSSPAQRPPRSKIRVNPVPDSSATQHDAGGKRCRAIRGRGSLWSFLESDAPHEGKF